MKVDNKINRKGRKGDTQRALRKGKDLIREKKEREQD